MKDRMERARVQIPQKVAYRVRVDIADALARRGAPDAAPVPEEAARPSRRARSARITHKTHIRVGRAANFASPYVAISRSVSSASLLLGPSSTSPSTPAPPPNTPAYADVLS